MRALHRLMVGRGYFTHVHACLFSLISSNCYNNNNNKTMMYCSILLSLLQGPFIPLQDSGSCAKACHSLEST